MGLLDKAKKKLKKAKDNSVQLGSGTPVWDTTHADAQSSKHEQIKPRQRGPAVWSGGKSPIVDIVFLHGLTGDREKTWTADGEDKPWPEALLPEDISNARIITYGYDADVARLLQPAGQNTVREHAQNLVNDLCSLRTRTRTSKRPILFVAHSLGGLVCQDALLLCVNPNEDSQGLLLESTRGVAFMGTPNAGSDFQKFASAVANIIRLSYVKAPNTQILEVLNERSQVLANIKNGFLTMVRRRNQAGYPEIKLHAFVEELPVTATGHRVVTPDSAVITGYNSTTIPANHMNMTKFSGRSDLGYERIVGTLIDWMLGIEDASDNTKLAGAKQDPVHDPPKEEGMNDMKLGSKNYYRYPKHASKFIARPDLIFKITNLMTKESTPSARVCVLCGMGGQGKTALTVDFCNQAETKHLFLAIFWLNASTEEALKKDLVSISDVVKQRADQTFGSNDERINFTRQTIENWNRPWLLVFDNYDNPNQFSLHKYIPRSSFGSILITSRNLDLSGHGTVIEVPPMSQKEALSLLYDRIGGAERFPDQEDYAKTTVKLLGYLPLAIDQAGAYIHRRVNFSLSRFIDEYEARKELIWSKAPTVWDYHGVVYTTWEMSFELIDEDENERTSKGQLLTMLSFLDFRDISQEIFSVPRRLTIIPAEISVDTPEWLQNLLAENGNWNWSKLEDLFHDFRDLSLLRLTNLGTGALRLSMHPLVSEWIKYRADLKSKSECLLQAIVIVTMCLRAQRLALESALSIATEKQLFRHKSSCMENLQELQKADANFLSNLYSLLDLTKPGDMESATSKKLTSDQNHRHQREGVQSVQEAMQHTNKLSNALQITLTQASDKLQDLLDDRTFQYDQAILEWLAPDDLQEQLYQENLSTAVNGSGMWFLNHPVFQDWVQGKNRELWCNGQPGSGKTVIASQVAEYLFHSHTMVLLIYCDYRQRNLQTTKSVLGSLLRQAIQKSGSIPDELRNHFKNAQNSNAAPDLDEIKTLFFGILRHTKKNSYLIIDGLDELQPQARKVVDIIRVGLSETTSVRLMVTSRPFTGHGEMPVNTSVINIDIKIKRPDVTKFITESLMRNSRLRTLTQHDIALRQAVESTLIEKSNGMFLYARLSIDQLADAVTKKALRESLHTLPRSMDAMYESILERVFSQTEKDVELAKRILKWLYFSYRPMSRRELQHALAAANVQPSDNGLDEEWLPSTDRISAVCHGLVSVNEGSGTIHYTHASIQNYIGYNSNRMFPEGQLKITQTCLIYLSLEPFASGPCLEIRLPERILEYPFSAYAAEFWVQHATVDEEKHVDQIVKFFSARRTYESWIQILLSIEKSALEESSLEGVPVKKALGMRLAACATPLEAARLLELRLVETALLLRGVQW